MKPAKEQKPPGVPREPGKRARLLIILAGIILGQAVLYGPSLAGWKLLLPLDILTGPNVYLPQAPGTAAIRPHDDQLSDLVYLGEPARRFAAREVHAGRLPIWTPYYFAGTPFNWPILSPFHALQCSTESPVIVAWTQLLAAIVAGLGAGAFCRRVLRVSFWPAGIRGVVLSADGVFHFLAGIDGQPRRPLAALAAVWLWTGRFGADIRRRRWLSLLSRGFGCCQRTDWMSAARCCWYLGLYALWCLWDVYRRRFFQRAVAKRVLTLGLAQLGRGFDVVGSARFAVAGVCKDKGPAWSSRLEVSEARPPLGLRALPQVVLPNMYGSTERGSAGAAVESDIPNLPESTGAAYTGLLATLLGGPLGVVQPAVTGP